MSDKPLINADAGQPISPLMAQVMEQMMRDTHATTSALIDSLQRDAAIKGAQLDAIRAEVEALFAGPWMPTPDAVLRALYPPHEVWQFFMPTPDNPDPYLD